MYCYLFLIWQICITENLNQVHVLGNQIKPGVNQSYFSFLPEILYVILYVRRLADFMLCLGYLAKTLDCIWLFQSQTLCLCLGCRVNCFSIYLICQLFPSQMLAKHLSGHPIGCKYWVTVFSTFCWSANAVVDFRCVKFVRTVVDKGQKMLLCWGTCFNKNLWNFSRVFSLFFFN